MCKPYSPPGTPTKERKMKKKWGGGQKGKKKGQKGKKKKKRKNRRKRRERISPFSLLLSYQSTSKEGKMYLLCIVNNILPNYCCQL